MRCPNKADTRLIDAMPEQSSVRIPHHRVNRDAGGQSGASAGDEAEVAVGRQHARQQRQRDLEQGRELGVPGERPQIE